MKETDLAGYENCGILLTGVSEEKSKPGRPQEISDVELQQALANLQFVLEQNWGLIGWELQQARTLADIRSALSLITGYNCPRLDVFRRSPTQRTTSTALRRLREEFAAALEKVRQDYTALRQCKESAERVSQAIANATDEESRRTVLALEPALAKKHAEAVAEWQASNLRIHELQEQLEQQEAHFAQSQLLDFLQSKRRRYTPLNLAMAMAGIPYLSARVSADRCTKLTPQVEPGHAYRMFQAVASVLGNLCAGV